jgi:hypothetical protein
MNCGSGGDSGGGFGNRDPSIASCFEIMDVNTVWVLIFINSMCLREFDLFISFSPFCIPFTTVSKFRKIYRNL